MKVGCATVQNIFMRYIELVKQKSLYATPPPLGPTPAFPFHAYLQGIEVRGLGFQRNFR